MFTRGLRVECQKSSIFSLVLTGLRPVHPKAPPLRRRSDLSRQSEAAAEATAGSRAAQKCRDVTTRSRPCHDLELTKPNAYKLVTTSRLKYPKPHPPLAPRRSPARRAGRRRVSVHTPHFARAEPFRSKPSQTEPNRANFFPVISPHFRESSRPTKNHKNLASTHIILFRHRLWSVRSGQNSCQFAIRVTPLCARR